MNVVAIVAAGGKGTRLGGALPKQLLTLGDRTILEWSVSALLSCDLVKLVVVVLPPALAAGDAMAAREDDPRIRVVSGGARRQDSVALGFDAVPRDADIVVVHDAARPFVSSAVIARTIDAAARYGAAVAAVRSRDTVKRAGSGPGGFVVDATLPREEIWLAQTPQAFRYEVLRDAVSAGRAGIEATDEAALAEIAGHPVRLVEGDVVNMKVTTEADLRVARALVSAGVTERGAGQAVGGEESLEVGPSAARPERVEARGEVVNMRLGVGYDLHRFTRGRPLVLGGVRIPHEFGLAGHSDADAIAHAVTDAVLGAAGQGDIGTLFPDDDPRWSGADSMEMLREAVRRVHGAGFLVSNVDVVVVAERPRIGPHREAIRLRLAGVLDVDVDRVSVKGKTNEGVDAVGRGEALAVHAVAALRVADPPPCCEPS